MGDREAQALKNAIEKCGLSSREAAYKLYEASRIISGNGCLRQRTKYDADGGTLTFSSPITYEQTPPMYGFAEIPHDPSLYERMKEKLDGLFSRV